MGDKIEDPSLWLHPLNEQLQILDGADSWRMRDILQKMVHLKASGRMEIETRIYIDDVTFLLSQVGFLLDLAEAKEVE